MTAAAALTPLPETTLAFAERMPDGHSLNSDEPQMETTLHQRQLVLLQTILEWHWRGRADYFIGANLSVYYDRSELRRRRFIGPDFFLVRNVDPWPRRSWVVWEEGGRYPDLIIELLSEGTAQVDRTDKRAHYQNIFRTPEYFWFDPVTGEFAALRLGAHRVYEPIEPTPAGLCWSEVLELYLGVHDKTLRYFDADGVLIPSPPESALAEQARADCERERAQAERDRADVEHERAELERKRAEVAAAEAATERARAAAEQARAERLAAQLRALGVEPD